MKTKLSVLTLAFCFTLGTVCFAATNPMMGTWKLNESKSKFTPGQPKNKMVVYSAAGDKMTVTVDGVDASGKATHNEWTGKADGKDYKVSGDAMSDTRSLKMIDEHTYDLTVKKGGKVTATGRIVVSADGKTRTVTIGGTDANGKKFKNVAVYNRK